MYCTTDELLEQSAGQSLPVIAFVAYRDQAGGYYIESHDIDDKGRLRAGIPLSKECVGELAAGFSSEQGRLPCGRIPSTLLYADARAGRERYVWYNPPGRRMMYFTKNIPLEDGLYQVPGVVYAVQGESLNIYAFKGKRPGDKLYRAPFFNVTDGHVCLGNAKADYPENPDYDALTAYWEKRFWGSEFSHLGGGSNPIKGNLALATTHWKERFDYGLLLPAGLSLEKLLG